MIRNQVLRLVRSQCYTNKSVNLIGKNVHTSTTVFHAEKNDEINNLVVESYLKQLEPSSSGLKKPVMFDTQVFTKLLVLGGFTEKQSEVLCRSLVDVLSTNTEHSRKNVVTKSQLELTTEQFMSRMNALQKDMIILEKSEFGALRHENEKQKLEIVELRKQVDEKIDKIKANILLDINLERARATEAHNKNERSVHALDNKIDREVAQLMATYERYRNDVFKYVGGAIMTCLGIVLGFYRLWK
ncbi:unnamed protein product [Dimorphilus gyrociliatus]|uniref:Uncharacterized protein n=1 Tax=Dimorphilus gyrociliatus TaxID=2664684 RepID=A0A7I8VGP9_9ANNE|nr:unnamed protein product [Dimorphilus gyrociliatus]